MPKTEPSNTLLHDSVVLPDRHHFCLGASWTGSRDRALMAIERTLRSDRVPQLTLLWGPHGSGGTTIARHYGMWTSCQAWEQIPPSCGKCECCELVMYGTFWLRGGFIEIDASLPGAESMLVEAMGYWLRTVKAYYGHGTHNPRPTILSIDNAHLLPPKSQERLLKPVENLREARFVLVTSEIKGIDSGLISRSSVHELTLPTVEQAAVHVFHVAQRRGLVLSPELALLISRRTKAIPKECLSVLDKLRSVRTPVTKSDIDVIIRPSLAEILTADGQDAEASERW